MADSKPRSLGEFMRIDPKRFMLKGQILVIESNPIPMDVILLASLLTEAARALEEASKLGFVTLRFDKNITFRELLRFLLQYDL